MGDFTPRGTAAEHRDRANHSAHVSIDSNPDDSLSDIDLNATQDVEQEVVPLFVNFTSTLKRRTEHHHSSVTKIPQCLGVCWQGWFVLVCICSCVCMCVWLGGGGGGGGECVCVFVVSYGAPP